MKTPITVGSRLRVCRAWVCRFTRYGLDVVNGAPGGEMIAAPVAKFMDEVEVRIYHLSLLLVGLFFIHCLATFGDVGQGRVVNPGCLSEGTFDNSPSSCRLNTPLFKSEVVVL